MQGFAEQISGNYTRSDLKDELKLKTFEQWTEESGKHAFTSAYDSLNMSSGDTVTDEYDARAKELVNHQFALAGYRLADYLSSTLKSDTPSTIKELIKNISE